MRSGSTVYDLENALEALDVDLDDLSVDEDAAPPMVLHKRRTSQAMPAQSPPRERPGSRQMPVPTHVPKRATTDDGVLIDFDDDDE